MLLSSVGANSIQGVNQAVQNSKMQQNVQRTNITQPSFQGSVEKVLYKSAFKENGKLEPVVKKLLDESKFIFDTDDGKQLMTIKDFIEKIIVRVDNQRSFPDMYHASFSKETIDKIIKNGFDKNHIFRAQNGPGFYFAFAEGQAMNYGTAKLKADVEGKMAVFPHRWYDKITHETDALDRIKKFTGAANDVNKASEAEKALNEYVRNMLVDEFGYDLGYANGELVCFNPDVITNLRHF